MVMIFKQFMNNCCCEMFFKFRIVIFIVSFLLLPFLVSAENVRKRRRPGVDTHFQESSSTSLPDQLALATSYKSNIPSESLFQSYDSSGLKSLDLNKEHFTGEETPEQFVAKALKLQSEQKINENPERNIIPESSYGKYEVYESSEVQSSSPAPQSYQKDAVTRSSFETYDDDDNESSSVNYRNSHARNPFSYAAFRYEPQFISGSYDRSKEEQHADDTIQSSSSSQIPQAEILKHIEESVAKYLKNLEAEGKLPIRESPKVYYKAPAPAPAAPAVESSQMYTVSKPKEVQLSELPQRIPVYTKPTAAPVNRSPYKELKYQPIDNGQEFDDNDNIEFVYKTRPRSSQVQQPKTSSFDHAAALKNLEGFDLSHAMHQQEEKPLRPKLYFSSEMYHDINSLPYKPEKLVQRPTEYKEKEKIRGYGNHENGDSLNFRHLGEQPVSGKGTEDGYPLANPYKYFLNPHPYPSKYAETNLTPQPSDWQGYLSKKQTSGAQTAPASYDSYNPKYNNNPEGHGYQHNYKAPETILMHPTKSSLRSLPKRGKRGGNGGNVGGYKKSGRGYSGGGGSGVKDSQTKVALRPPPYKE